MSRQLMENPKAEICAFMKGEWIRVSGELVEDDRVTARQSMLDAYPSLQKMYAADDGNTQVFYFRNEVATISSFIHEPEIIHFSGQRGIGSLQTSFQLDWIVKLMIGFLIATLFMLFFELRIFIKERIYK